LLCEKAEWPVQPVFDLMCCVTPEDHGISLSCPKIFSDWKENTKRAEHYGKQKKKKNTCRLLIERSRRTNVCHALREKVSSGVKKKNKKERKKKLNFYMFRAAPSIIGFFQSFSVQAIFRVCTEAHRTFTFSACVEKRTLFTYVQPFL
jgi:4-diphosphocytidyl-2C-methyl-D-erythritol kinase